MTLAAPPDSTCGRIGREAADRARYQRRYEFIVPLTVPVRNRRPAGRATPDYTYPSFRIAPRGVEHRPVTAEEVHVTLNTGDVRNERTVATPEHLRRTPTVTT